MMLIFLMFMKYLILVLMVLLSVALYTLYERSVLGYIQIRKGPNSVGYMGILQPFSDGAKLFLKEDIIPLYINSIIYYISPIYGMCLALMMVYLFMYMGLGNELKWGILLFLCISSMSVYSVILSGWSSVSKYSNLGSYRAVAQTISYEISLSFLVLIFIMGFMNFSFSKMGAINLLDFYLYLAFIMVWLGIILAETHRSPFDLSESESELVSGFNTEYSGGGFALIFIAEYMNIIMMSVISVMLFCGHILFGVVFIMSWYLWVRGSFPRMRYDYLMFMSWKMFLPFCLGGVVFFIMVFVVSM